MQGPGKIKNVKKIHSRAWKVFSTRQATLSKPIAMEDEKLAEAKRNSIEVIGEHKEE